MEVRKILVDKSKYNIKCPYEMEAEFIIVHNTANDAPARNEVAYMVRNNNEVSFHFAVDDIEIVQGIPTNRNTWNAGDGSNGKGNRKGIAIEICYSKTGGDKFIKAERNAAEFIASILKEKGWGIDKVKKHQDFNGKYCPHRTLDMGWERFLDMIKLYMNVAPETTLKIEEIEKMEIKLITDTNLWNLDFTNIADAKAVKAYKKGDTVGNIVALATHPCGSKYYMTEYSYKNKINNGFNVVDCEKYERRKCKYCGKYS